MTLAGPTHTFLIFAHLRLLSSGAIWLPWGLPLHRSDASITFLEAHATGARFREEASASSAVWHDSKGGRCTGPWKARLGQRNGRCNLDKARVSTWKPLDVTYEEFECMLECAHEGPKRKR